MHREIDIKSREQAINICKLAGKSSYEVWLSAGTVLVNAASMLSMLTMVGKTVSVVAKDDTDAQRFTQLVHEMA
jgi:hypothetical protein